MASEYLLHSTLDGTIRCRAWGKRHACAFSVGGKGTLERKRLLLPSVHILWVSLNGNEEIVPYPSRDVRARRQTAH